MALRVKPVKSLGAARAKAAKQREALNRRLFLNFLLMYGRSQPECEVRFAPPRKWRADFLWREQRTILEVDGGVLVRGRHTRGAGFLADIEKMNAAQLAGFLYLRTTPRDLCTLATLRLLSSAFGRAR